MKDSATLSDYVTSPLSDRDIYCYVAVNNDTKTEGCVNKGKEQRRAADTASKAAAVRLL